MTHELIRKTAKVLFELCSTAVPELRNLQSWWDRTVDTLVLWSTSEGNQGVKRMKSILSMVVQLAFNEPVDDPPAFTQSTNSVPVVVKEFWDWIMSHPMTPKRLTVVLSLCRICDIFEGNPTDKDILNSVEVIESSGVGKRANEFARELEEFIPQFIDAYADSKFVKNWAHGLRPELQHRSSKRGPNGPSMESAHLDACTIDSYKAPSGAEMRDIVLEAANMVCSCASRGSYKPDSMLEQAHNVRVTMDSLGTQYSECPGKISVLPEKGGKLRLIAQCDYFSQEVLLPVHKWLADLLRSLPQDATFDQGGAITKCADWTSQGCYLASFDQSSCTDRFPVVVQESILNARFGKQAPGFGGSITRLMVDREFQLKLPSGATRRVQWKTGQPMGAYASWPLMAITHHLLVQWCAWQCRGRKFPSTMFDRYVILGDDIVIADRNVADKYLKTVRMLGMKINLSKSHISGEGTNVPPVSEFAKVICWKGHVIQVVRPTQVAAALQNWHLVPKLFSELRSNETFPMKLKSVLKLVMKFWNKSSKILTFLATVPQELGGMGFKDMVSLKQRVTVFSGRGEFDPLLLYIASLIRAKIVQEMKVLESSVEVRLLPKDVGNIHPVTIAMESHEFRSKRSVIYSPYAPPTVANVAEDILLDNIDIGAYLSDIRTVGEMLTFGSNYDDDRDAVRRCNYWANILSRPTKYTPPLRREEYFADHEQIRVNTEKSYSVICSAIAALSLHRDPKKVMASAIEDPL